MKSRLIAEEQMRTWIPVFEAGDEVASTLKSFARENKLASSSFKAIGALSAVKTGWFNRETKNYETSADLHEQVELLSLIGDVALDPDGQPQVHAHLVVGKRDGTAHGGHLLEAHVWPTVELVLTESPAHLRKQFDREAGIALIRP
jgi:uncharacterized protein